MSSGARVTASPGTPAETLRGLAVGVALLLSAATEPLAAQYAAVRVQVIDVGQGDGILIRTPNQRWVLIDAGQGTMFGDSLATQFGVDRFAIVIGSHRHKDHIGGIDAVLRALTTQLYIGDTAEYAGGSDDDRLRAVVRERHIRVAPLRPDTQMVDGVRFIILPRPPTIDPDENNNSVTVRLEYGRFSMLFAGDAETAERDWLVANVPALLDVEVLKAAHHGSTNGTSRAWLAAVTPNYVVISAGVNRTYRHPQGEAVAAYLTATGGRLSCTNRQGTVRIYGYADGRVQVRPQRTSNKSCTYDGTQY